MWLVYVRSSMILSHNMWWYISIFKCLMWLVFISQRGRDRVIGIAIQYGLGGGPEIETQWGCFLHPSRPVLRPSQPFKQWVLSLRNVHLKNLGPDLHRRYQLHTKSLQDLTELNTLSGTEGYTMDTQPSAPGPQQRYRYGYIRDIPNHPPHSHTFCT